MSDEVDASEKTRLALEAQAQRLEAVIANLEAELEEDDAPATRRRLEASVQKLAEVQQQLAPLAARREHQLLEDLQKALSGKLDEQLACLRHVWRKYRHPRVADLIDCLSAELVSTLAPVPTSELPAIWARRDPTEVSRLLTLPWPTTPELEDLVVQAVLWLPDDPRVAAFCAREIDLARWKRGNLREYGPLYERLNALGDVRQLPLLERQLQRRRFFELDDKAVATHRKLAPRLPPEFDEAIGTLEAQWSGWLERRDATSRKTRELLDAVLAEPGETSRRLVFADWLTELGDPRGELINLQLGPPSDASTQRQQELIAAHWREWLRSILDALDGAPRFERGFPVAAKLRSGENHGFADPAWRTFESLTLGDTSWGNTGATPAHEVARAPNLVSLRELRNVPVFEVKDLLHTKAPLTSIALRRLYTVDPLEEAELDATDFASMPTLERLELFEGEARRWLDVLPAVKTLRVHLVEPEGAADLAWLLEDVRAKVVEVVFPEAEIRLERDDRGELTRATCLAGPAHLPEYLDALPRALISLACAVPPAPVTAAALEQFKASLRRFPRLEPGELPLVVRSPRRYFRFEAERLIVTDKLLDLLERRFDLQLDHVVPHDWGSEKPYRLEAGERGEPTSITSSDEAGFCAVLPVLEPEALSEAIKSFVRDHYVRSGKLTFEGRVLHVESWQWPSLEQVRAWLGAA